MVSSAVVCVSRTMKSISSTDARKQLFNRFHDIQHLDFLMNLGCPVLANPRSSPDHGNAHALGVEDRSGSTSSIEYRIHREKWEMRCCACNLRLSRP
jgi:hypothetical protein